MPDEFYTISVKDIRSWPLVGWCDGTAIASSTGARKGPGKPYFCVFLQGFEVLKWWKVKGGGLGKTLK